MLKLEREVDLQLSGKIEALGERYTVWLKVKSEREDLKNETETSNTIEEHVSVFFGGWFLVDCLQFR